MRRQPPEKVPSSRHEPVKVASNGPYDTVMVTPSSWMSHRYGSGSGEKFEYTLEGNVFVGVVADQLQGIDLQSVEIEMRALLEEEAARQPAERGVAFDGFVGPDQLPSMLQRPTKRSRRRSSGSGWSGAGFSDMSSPPRGSLVLASRACVVCGRRADAMNS
jgi:hypothetical protein